MLPNLTVDELAQATAAAFRIVAETLEADYGVDPNHIADRAEAKAHDYVAKKQDNVGNLLRIFLARV